MALYKEDVHLLVKGADASTTISDLNGKVINLGPEDSGTYIYCKDYPRCPWYRLYTIDS
jgi:TRAP-type uncharacterized transport system substrate-binding protein